METFYGKESLNNNTATREKCIATAFIDTSESFNKDAGEMRMKNKCNFKYIKIQAVNQVVNRVVLFSEYALGSLTVIFYGFYKRRTSH